MIDLARQDKQKIGFFPVSKDFYAVIFQGVIDRYTYFVQESSFMKKTGLISKED